MIRGFILQSQLNTHAVRVPRVGDRLKSKTNAGDEHGFTHSFIPSFPQPTLTERLPSARQHSWDPVISKTDKISAPSESSTSGRVVPGAGRREQINRSKLMKPAWEKC